MTRMSLQYNLAIIHVGAYTEYLQYRLIDSFASNVHETPARVFDSCLRLDEC